MDGILQGQRLEQRLQSQARSKVRLNLSFVRAIVKTKARDESEVIWTRLPFPRAQLPWKKLRERTPATANMGLQEVRTPPGFPILSLIHI